MYRAVHPEWVCGAVFLPYHQSTEERGHYTAIQSDEHEDSEASTHKGNRASKDGLRVDKNHEIQASWRLFHPVR